MIQIREPLPVVMNPQKWKDSDPIFADHIPPYYRNPIDIAVDPGGNNSFNPVTGQGSLIATEQGVSTVKNQDGSQSSVIPTGPPVKNPAATTATGDNKKNNMLLIAAGAIALYFLFFHKKSSSQ